MILVEVYGGQRSLAFELTTAIIIINGNTNIAWRHGNYGRSLFTSSDALSLSYRRLVGAKAIKLGSWDNKKMILLNK